MEMSEIQKPSLFAQIVDELRTKSDEELKLIYMRVFSSNLKDEWTAINSDADFKNASEDDIIAAIQKRRYNQSNV